jgi:alpha-2-macroglobulin-like protein
MKSNKYLLASLAVFLLMVSGFHFIEDPDFLKRLREKLKAYNTAYAEEKVYLQFDKPFYKPGEDIWFNAFVLNSNSHKPTTISDVVYVELIDPKGNVSTRLELIIREGTAYGDFKLEDVAPGGLYTVRAFTQWMKNFGAENIFSKQIQVQRIITPRLLLKLDYEKESYGADDEVKAKLTVRNLKNEMVNQASVRIIAKTEGKVISQATIVSDAEGAAAISFHLPHELRSADGLLQAIVSVNGTEESISRSIPIVLNKIDLQFFPEGGQWIEGVQSRIAFKALNEFRKGADVSGTIIDEKGQVITTFESYHMGMGAFELQPGAGKKYFARIDRPAGNKNLTPLPGTTRLGFRLNLKKSSVSSTEWSIHSPMASQVNLVAQVHGEIVYAEPVILARGENSVAVSHEKFPAGIAVFTLFDGNGVEQCERLVFVNHEKGLHISLKPDKARYIPGEKVQVKINTTNSDGQPVPAKISLSVADDQLISFADDKQNNILSSLLLSSEIKGDIQEPSFYFDPKEPKATQALDYLLMTQGWRRFTWKEVREMKQVLAHSPEKVKNIAGRVVDSRGKGMAGEITFLEIGNKKRIENVQTTEHGYFLFKNIDPTTTVLLLTKKPGHITLEKATGFSISFNDKDGTVLVPEQAVAAGVPPVIKAEVREEDNDLAGLDLALGTDVQQLSEVVVVAFGAEDKRKLTGSITTIHDELDGAVAAMPFEHLLQGRVAGVTVQPPSGNAGVQANVMIRGASSLMTGRNEPLYVIDGHPVGTSLNQSFSNGSMIAPEEISSIEVLTSPEATAIFGSAAANGVVLIATRSRLGYFDFQSRQRPPRYSSLTVTPRKFSTTREFYTPPPSSHKKEKREDFRSTVYWNHTIVTDGKGQASISFYNNDAVSAFRITAEGISGSGLAGRAEVAYHTQLPFSLDIKLPEFLGFEDELKLAVNVKNETSSTLTGKLTLTAAAGISIDGEEATNVEVAPESVRKVRFTLRSTGIEGDFPITIKLKSPGYDDEIKHIIHVQPVGFPVQLSFSGKQLDKSVRFSVDDAEKGTLKAALTAFPDVLSDLFTGAESILREPYGCFEQTSSSTFPNILALQFMEQTGLINEPVRSKALGYIRNGYKRLVSFEVSGGGFEWFGQPAAHEALTAYGLIEFHEMKKVYPEVSDRLIERTRQWLLSRRNGNGTFKLQTRGFDDFSRPSGNVSNIYITYALSETGERSLDTEYQYNLTEAWKANDMYQLALMASIAYNLKKFGDYEKLIAYFEKKILSPGLDQLYASHSVVRSQGISLSNETVSLWALALMKSPHAELDKISKCINYLLSRRSFGMFGSTQATILSLKALTEYARLARSTRDAGEIQVLVGNQIAERLPYQKEVRDPLVMNRFADRLIDGEQTLRVHFDGTTEPLPYSVNIQWYTKKPPSSEACQVGLTTSLAESAINVNETVRLTIALTNKSSDGLPMTLAVIGIPAGLNVQPWQLKELQEKKVFDFYEVIGGKLILYYRQMSPLAVHAIHLDLKAEIAGTFQGASSSAYLYYTNEYKHWVKGTSITIK